MAPATAATFADSVKPTGKFFEVLIGKTPEPLWNVLSKVAVLYALEPVFTVIFVINSNTVWEKVMSNPVASTINTLAGALYKVFCASHDQARKEMHQACFDYLSLGGVFSTGLVSLLSGLNPRPLSLVLHFFAVAIYGVEHLLLPFPSPKCMLIGAKLISAKGVRQMFFPATVPAYYRAPPVK